MHSLAQIFKENIKSFHVALHNQFKQPHNTGKENFCSIWSFMYINQYMFSLVHSSVFTYKQNSLNKQWKVLLIAGWTIYVLLFKPTQVWHFVGIYLHTLWLLRALAKQINHRKAPQSANTSELQPAPVTNCLAVCTSGLRISHSLLHTGFTDPRRLSRVHHACFDSGQCNAKARLWYFFSIERNSLLKSTGFCFFFFNIDTAD